MGKENDLSNNLPIDLQKEDFSPNVQKNAKTNFKIRITLIIILVILCGFILSCIFYLNTQVKKPISQSQNTQSVSNIQQQITPTIKAQEAKAEWLPEPQKVDSVGFFTLIDKYFPYQAWYYESEARDKSSYVTDKYEPKATYYKVGTMLSPYKGSAVYLAIVKNLPESLGGGIGDPYGFKNNIVYDYNTMALFIKTPDNKFIVTNDYNNCYILGTDHLHGWACKDMKPQGSVPAGIIYNSDLYLDWLGLGKYVFIDPTRYYTDQDTGLKLYLTASTTLFDKSGLFFIKNLEPGYALYSNQNFKDNEINLKTILNPTFIVRLPTGLEADVEIENNSVGDIMWFSQEEPGPLPIDPTVFDVLGTNWTFFIYCSNKTHDNISDTESLDVQNNLNQAGTTNKGENVYDIKNKNLDIFQEFWSQRNSQSTPGAQLTFDDYLAFKPILVLKQQLGNYRFIFRSRRGPGPNGGTAICF